MDSVFSEILTIDQELLLFINNLHFSVGDMIMWRFSERFFWIPFYVFLLILLIRRIGFSRSVICVIILALMIFATDQFGASILRPYIGRLRPSSPLNPISEMLHFVNDYRGGSLGFPSLHAANTFALFTYLSCILKSNWIRYTLLIWAVLVSCSRIYLGVHYPTDIFAGAILGIFMGYNFYLLFNFLPDLKFNRKIDNLTKQ